jgi:hypothetical protein
VLTNWKSYQGDGAWRFSADRQLRGAAAVPNGVELARGGRSSCRSSSGAFASVGHGRPAGGDIDSLEGAGMQSGDGGPGRLIAKVWYMSFPRPV